MASPRRKRSWSFSTRLMLAAVLALAAYSGCSDDPPTETTPATTSSVTVTGAGGGSSCNGSKPDNVCIADGPAKEDCSCEDCATRALCNGGCTDDGNCDIDGDEDCSCADCFLKVDQCAPGGGDCDTDPMDEDTGVCNFGERCTCQDCTADPFCTDNCDDNGECIALLEGCSCADCASHQDCGGNGSSSGSGGAGGSGGGSSSSGTGGSASGAGGAGGAGGN